MKCSFVLQFILLFILLWPGSGTGADDDLTAHLGDQEYGGLEKILTDRYMRILTTRNAFDYYISNGKPKGIQYEMAKLFTKELNEAHSSDKKQLPIVFELIPVDYDQLIPMLLSGKGDVIAAGLTVTPLRQSKVAFTEPFRLVDEVIVTRRENQTKDWRGESFSVRKSSSYYESIMQKPKQVKVKLVDDSLHTENILELVSLKKYDYTLVDSYLAEQGLKAFEGLTILKDKPFGKNQKIAWAVKKKDKELLKALNNFMPKVKKGTLLGNMFSKRYFSDMGRIKSADFDLKSARLSRYDHLIKKYAKKYDFDWRLLAAVCYQESQFKQDIVNKWGAIGLFQIKQTTANEPYVNIPNIQGGNNAENNIHAGVKYLSWIKKRYFDPIETMDENAKLRMTMAAYNAGPARVRKARKKASQMGLKDYEWFRQVELAMLEMGYTEPVFYVSEINKHYAGYLLL